MKSFKHFIEEDFSHKSVAELKKIARSWHPSSAKAMSELKKRGIKIKNPAVREEIAGTSTADVVGTGSDVADWKTPTQRKRKNTVTKRYIEIAGKRKKITKEETSCCDDCAEELIKEAAEYQGRKVTLNDPFRTPKGPKKFSVYVKNDKGNVVKVNFGDPNMEIKRDDPERRKSFRARHNCDNPGPKWKARYWSCRMWSKGQSVSDLD